MSARKKGKRKMKSKTKPAKTGSSLSLLNIKVSKRDRAALVAAARKYADGNLSAWLRFAGTQLKRSMPANG